MIICLPIAQKKETQLKRWSVGVQEPLSLYKLPPLLLYCGKPAAAVTEQGEEVARP